ncbi:peptidoglycan-binding protein, partial [Streptomyces sp. TRM76130]|nr:peptidoglycan-binding protein [Streptomyces sp. TRM76130]
MEAAGPACPECGAPRQADHTPSCACGPRAAAALLEARTAEAAAAEDFNPLRIRPYVALEETGRGTGREEGGAGAAGGPGASGGSDAPDEAGASGGSGGSGA